MSKIIEGAKEAVEIAPLGAILDEYLKDIIEDARIHGDASWTRVTIEVEKGGRRFRFSREG